MPRDVELTKRRLRESALAEFAEHGPHGTTVERISARAGVNRERLYNYFGDKMQLFSSVLGEELGKIAAAVPLTVDRLEDVGEFVGRAFDYQQAHPDLSRLVTWEGLSETTGSVPEEDSRGALYHQKVDAVAAAQRGGLIDDTIGAAHLVFLLISLSSYWGSAPQIARMLSGASSTDPDERRMRRAAAVEAALRLAAPRSTAHPTGDQPADP